MPKRNTKKRSYYDPNAALGYEVLRRSPEFMALGTAIQAHDQRLASLIDLEARKQYVQDAREREWEETKRRDKSAFLEKLSLYPLPTAMGTMNLLGAVTENVGVAYNHIKNRDIPDMPEDYGMSDFLKDLWNSFFDEMNHLQAEDARGYLVRAMSDRDLINKYNRSLDILDELDSINYLLSNLNTNINDSENITQKQFNAILSLVNSLNQRKNLLLKEYDSLSKDREKLELLTNQTAISRVYDDIVAGLGFLGGALDSVIGKTTAIHDELNDARRYLSNLGTSRADRLRNRKNLKLALNELDNLNEGWNAVIKENEDESKRRKDKVSSWFKARAERATTDFTDPDTYLFKMPGIMGGSSSSWMKQYPAMAVQLIAALASGGTSTAASAAILGAGAGTSFFMLRGAGISENNAEVAQNAIERIKNKAGLSDEDINKILSGDMTDQKKLRLIAENVKDVENLFNTDMAATTWDAALQSALMAVPIGSMARAGQFLRGRKALRFIAKHPLLKNAVRSETGAVIAGDLAQGYKYGETLGPVGGGVAAVGTAGTKALGRVVVDAAEGTRFGTLAKNLAKRIENLGKASTKLDVDAVEYAHRLAHDTNMKYLRGIGGRLLTGSISEGIEEGKQFLAGQAFLRGDLDGKLMDTADIAFTDFLNGLTSAGYILGIPLDGLGLLNLKDKELLLDIKGGMLGGLLHNGAMHVLSNTFPYIRERRADEIVAQTLLSKKLATLSDLKQYTSWLKSGLLRPDRNYVHTQFSRLRKMNEDHKGSNGEYAIDPKLIDLAQDKYQHVISVAKDPLTRLQAQAAGINVRSIANPQSWKSNVQYHEFVAAKVVAEDKINEIKDNKKEADNHLLSTILSVNDRIVGRDLQSINPQEEVVVAQSHPLFQNDQTDNVEITKQIAYLAALLKYREQIETAIEANAGNKHARVRRGLKDQLNRLNDSIKDLSKHVSRYALVNADIKTLDDLESHMVFNQREHEMLRDAYEDKVKWDFEYESAIQAYENLVGKIQKIDEDGNTKDLTDEEYKTWNPYENLKDVTFTKGNALDVINDIHQMEDEDDDFESRVEQVFQDDLKAEHLREENGWPKPKIYPERYSKVIDESTGYLKLIDPQDLSSLMRLNDDEIVDQYGMVYRLLDYGRKDPLEESQKRTASYEEGDLQLQQAFRETYLKLTGTELPQNPEQYLLSKAPLGFVKLSKDVLPTPSSQKGPIDLPTPVKSTKVELASQEKSKQDEVVELLEKRYNDDLTAVLNDDTGYHTTNLDYFITHDGRPVRMSRVHNVKPLSYIKTKELDDINSLYKLLKSAKSLPEIENIVKTYRQNTGVNYQIIPYVEYIKDNESVFIHNPSPETAKEFDVTLKHLAQAIVDASIEKGASVRVGNLVDEFSRNFFGTPNLYQQTSTEDGIRQLYNSINQSEDRTYKDLFKDYDSFKQLIKQVREQYDYYTNKLGWKLVALPIKWRANFEGTGWIAGETDLIGVDKLGDIHIIDFKTSKRTFGTNEILDLEASEQYSESLEKLTKNDFFATKDGKPIERLSRNARVVLRSIKNDYGKNITIRWSDLNGAMIYSKTRGFVGMPNKSYGQVLSAYLDYSNQQTAYSLMIAQAETGSTVKSIEILAYRCTYDWPELRTVGPIVLEGRIMLPFSSDIIGKFYMSSEESIKNRIDQLRSLIDELYLVLIDAANKIRRVVSGDVFNTLSTNGKFICADYLSKIDNVEIPTEDDVLLLENVLYEIDSLIDEYSTVTQELNQDYQTEKAKDAQQQERQQKAENVERHVLKDPLGQAVDTVRAPNKRLSFGNSSLTNLNYRQVEADRDLELATSSPDFITSADFEVYAEGRYVYVDIKYRGKTYKRILIDTTYRGEVFPNAQRLINQIAELEKIRKPGLRIVPVRSSMSRTNGAIKILLDDKGNETYLPIEKTDLFANEDLYDIEFSSTYGKLGYVNQKNEVVTFGLSTNDIKTIYQWSDLKLASKPGTFVYLKQVRKDELNRDSIIPVAIDRVNFSDNDISFILSLLQNPNLLDKEYFVEINGEAYNIHATGRQLANLLIPIVDHSSKVSNASSILRDPANPNLVYLVKREDLGEQQQTESYDLSTLDGVNLFVNKLKNMVIEESHDLLSSRLGNNNNVTLPFAGIKKFFAQSDIKQLKISDAIQFDFDDFVTKTSKSGAKRQGFNGFAYMLKHGLLKTGYAGMGSCNVEIRDVMLEDSNTTQIQDSGALSIPENPIDTIDLQAIDIDSSEIEAFLNKTLDKKSLRKKRLPKEVAERHIKEILGDKVPIKFYESFIKVAGGPAHIIGNCKADALEISNLAYRGVEYHEAFHRIFELLIPDNQRDKIYEKIAKRLKVDLYNKDGSENKVAFRICAEYAADKYMEHMNWHMTDIKIPFLTKAFNFIHDWASMFYHIKNRDLYKIFIQVNRGYYKDAMPSQKSIDRFNRLYKNLYAHIHGVEFTHIANRLMYDKLRETAMMCIIQGQNVDTSGRNISQIGKNINKVTFKAGIDKLLKAGYDLIGQTVQEELSVGQLAMRELYEKFDNESLRDDMADRISIISTDYVKNFESESEEDAQGNDVQKSDIGEHTRASYEFSRFSKTSSRVRFFFATLPDSYYGEPTEIVDKSGNKKVVRPIKLLLNELGFPQFVPVETVFNEVLNLCHDVDNTSELLERLQNVGKTNPVYMTLYQSLKKKIDTMYTTKDGKVARNADNEALVVQLMNIICSNRHQFDMARSTLIKTGDGVQYDIMIQPSGTEYNAKFYPTLWNSMLVYGGTKLVKRMPNGSLLFNDAIKGAQYSFKYIGSIISHSAEIKTAENGAKYSDVGMAQWINNAMLKDPKQVYFKVKHNGKTLYLDNPNNYDQLSIAKLKFVEVLNLLGINIHMQEFDYMLNHKYGSSGIEAMSYMFNSTSIKDSMTSFLNFLLGISPNGKINSEIRVGRKLVKIENAYAEMAFLKDLANWKYQYRHAHDLLSVLATNNNKFYEISDNSYMTDVVRNLNKRTLTFEDIKSDYYNYFVDESSTDNFGERQVYGSLVLKQLSDDPSKFITARDFIGFKTDKRGDFGRDYFKITKSEDYVAKIAILQNGGIISPTMSDKKTWKYIDGIQLPGFNYDDTIDNFGNVVPMNNLGDMFLIPKDSISQFENMLTPNPLVIDQFIQYAICEYLSILKADQDLDLMEKNGTKATEVDNYYTKEQGAKFSSLLGVWEYTYKTLADGTNVVSGEKFVPFSNNKKTRKQNIKIAQDHFFNKSREEQEILIARLLHKRFLLEVDTCTKHGLIEKVGDSENIFENYKNVGLSHSAIDSIYKSLIVKNGEPIDENSKNLYKSYATLMYIYDISNKAIMSILEFERVFSGNPSFYKWTYDSLGNLTDRTVDELKRFGGIGSTGNNNFVELKDVPQKYLDSNGNFTGKYVCAQVNNELVSSPQLLTIENGMKYGELTTALISEMELDLISELEKNHLVRVSEINKLEMTNVEKTELLRQEQESYNNEIDQIRKDVLTDVDSMSIELIEQKLSPEVKSIALKKAEIASNTYAKEINVADGAAYISDTMAEMLLRMNGNYSSAIQTAFLILREEKTSTLLQKQQAYEKVLTSVIGSYKYSAFGRRKHPITGVLVTYYDKMALFPLFRCMSTGRMQNIYDKMGSLRIDMLLVDSAVKIGGQYSKGIDWDSFMSNSDESDPNNHIDGKITNPLKPTFDSFEFGIYKLNFADLRKQLNTDPHEESERGLGTQMTKVAMSNLYDGREYYTQSGEPIDGKDLLNRIMSSINTLSDRGLKKIERRFFKPQSEDDNVTFKILNEEKFSKEIKKLLSSKDPDENVLRALEIQERKEADGTVKKHLTLPLNAISNSRWLESVLISQINRDVIDVITTGDASIQRSIWAMEKTALYDPKKGGVVFDEDLPPTINDGQRLRMINDEGSMDCVVSVDFIKKMFGGELPRVPVKDKNRNIVWDLIPELDKNGDAKRDEDGKIIYAKKRDKDGLVLLDKNGNPVYKRRIRTREMSFDELRSWLKKRGIIGNDAKASIVGYRIPTQAQSSIHALRIVDILPVVNDTIMLPEEFTKITGSDKYRCSNIKKFL